MELRLPDIGEGLTEAEIVRWLVAVGDRVREDQPIVEIQTDKAVTEMPAPATGVVATLGGGEGDLIRVGEVLVVIDDGNGAGGRARGRSASPAPRAAPAVTPAPPKAAPRPHGAWPAGSGSTSPSVSGTGPGGRITRRGRRGAPTAPCVPGDGVPAGCAGHDAAAATADAVAAVGQLPPTSACPFRGVRRRTPRTSRASWQQVPHVSSFVEV